MSGFIDGYGVVDLDQLDAAIGLGLVRAVPHPVFPDITINTYTQRAVIAGVWNEVTRACRGLIVDRRDASIVSRGPAKFFNYNESHAPKVMVYSHVEAFDKVDGSLGILYRDANGWAIASKGSFSSPQALTGTTLLYSKYSQWLDGLPDSDGLSFIFEIVYPGNRIVLDYGDQEDLVFLGIVHNATGRWTPASWVSKSLSWRGPVSEPVFEGEAGHLLNMEDRPNKEGVVVYLPTGNPGEQLVKIKQADYLALHKLVTGLSERVVWEHISGWEDGKFGSPRKIEALLESIPDEFHAWARGVASRLHAEFDVILDQCLEAEGTARLACEQKYGEDYTRAQFVDELRPSRWFNYILSGPKRVNRIWKDIRPEARALWQQEEARAA